MANEDLNVGNDKFEEAHVPDFAAERLKLEREALAVEREHLAALRAHAEARAQLSRAQHPLMYVALVLLLALLCFAGGLLAGVAIAENREQRRREDRLAHALRQIDDISFGNAGTNTSALTVRSAGEKKDKAADGKHPNVAVVVIQ